VQEGRENRSYELLVYAAIIPALPNLSSADLRLIRSNQARRAALAAVIGAADDLLAERDEGPAAFPATVLGSNQQHPIEPAGEFGARPTAPDMQPPSPTEPSLAPEPQAGDATTKGRNLRTPAAILAGLAIVALVVAVVLEPSSNSTHVAATKTSTSLASPKDAPTTQPPPAVAPSPPTSANPDATVPDTQNVTVPDDIAPPLLITPPTTEACPLGTVTVAVGQVQAQQSPSDPTSWDVAISGTLTNRTNTAIVVPAVNVTITTSGGDEPAYGDSNSSQLAPGQTGNWSATSYVSSTARPTATAQPGTWVWADSRYAECPSG